VKEKNAEEIKPKRKYTKKIVEKENAGAKKTSEFLNNFSVDDEEVLPVSLAEKKEKQKERRKYVFEMNKSRFDNLVSEDCYLTDIERALEPIEVKKRCAPTAAYVKAIDGRFDWEYKALKCDEDDKKAYARFYNLGVEAALRIYSEQLGDAAFFETIESCQKLIAILLEDHTFRVSITEKLDVAELAARISFYFVSCERLKRSYTVPGLAYTVGFMNRNHMIQFLEDNPETLFAYVLSRALMRIEDQRNVEIISGGGLMTGHKLDLATNFNWNDAKQKAAPAPPPPPKEETVKNIINNTQINVNSLPPETMSVEEWQRKFLTQQNAKVISSSTQTVSEKSPSTVVKNLQ